MKLVESLRSRGLVYQVSEPDLDARLAALAAQKPICAYVGFDPTSDSLHVGNFVPIICLMHAQRQGIAPIAIAGGATGLIGDPSGKKEERQLQTKEKVAENVLGIRKVLERFLDFSHPTHPARIVNNLDWIGTMSAIDFLRDVGKNFRIGAMLAKDSVKKRMEGSDEGMSYTEFSYQLLQGYDFYRLYRDYNCVLQMGGSDQWGNITAGTDLIRRMEGEGGNAFALTVPLITTSSGEKFGKSEGNAVWLTADKTSVFDFYQFWLRSEDADAERYLKFFTFLPLEEIQQVVAEHAKAPEKRLAQKKLAETVTEMVHGNQAVRQAIAASQTMYGGGVEQLTAESVAALAAQGVASTAIARARIEAGLPLVDACVEAGLAKTKSDARRLIQQGGLYVNNQAVAQVAATLKASDLIDNSAVVLRSGKKNYRLLRVEG